MSLSEFIDQLEELEKDYGDLDLPWELVRVKTEDLEFPAKQEREDRNVAEEITIDMGNARAAQLPEGENGE